MWVVFTDEMVYKPWVECSRPKNPIWDYYAMDRHGFLPDGGHSTDTSLKRYIICYQAPRGSQPVVNSVIFANRSSPIYVIRRVKGRYETADDTASGRFDDWREEVDDSSKWEKPPQKIGATFN